MNPQIPLPPTRKGTYNPKNVGSYCCPLSLLLFPFSFSAAIVSSCQPLPEAALC